MIAIVFAAALMAAAPAAGEQAAQATTAPAAAPTKAAKAAKTDMVCKKEAVVGSRMKTRICLTQEEWDQRAVAAKDDLEGAQRNQPMRVGQ